MLKDTSSWRKSETKELHLYIHPPTYLHLTLLPKCTQKLIDRSQEDTKPRYLTIPTEFSPSQLRRDADISEGRIRHNEKLGMPAEIWSSLGG